MARATKPTSISWFVSWYALQIVLLVPSSLLFTVVGWLLAGPTGAALGCGVLVTSVAAMTLVDVVS